MSVEKWCKDENPERSKDEEIHWREKPDEKVGEQENTGD